MSISDSTTPRLALLQRRFPTPHLSPLAALVDKLSQDVAATDLHIDNCAESLTGDEAVELASIMAMLLACTDALRETVAARERRLLSDGTGHHD